MAGNSFDRIVGVVSDKALGSEGHALIDLDIIADNCCGSDNHTGAVVNDEAFAYAGSGVDVDSGVGMGLLGDHARHHRDPKLQQAVGYAVAYRGLEAGIADYYLMGRGCGRVAEIGGVNVSVEDVAQVGQAVYKRIGQRSGMPAYVSIRNC